MRPTSGSAPTRPSRMPSTIMAMAFSSEPWASVTAATRPSTISEKRSAGPNLKASSASGGAKVARIKRRDAAGEERAERRDRQRRSGAALSRHLIAVQAGDHRRRLAGQVDQNRRGRTAVLRAVVDAGEHDQRGDRREVEGDRQQHGDGRDRPDPRQHPDQRAQRHAQQAPADVRPRSARRRTRARGWTAGPSERCQPEGQSEPLGEQSDGERHHDQRQRQHLAPAEALARPGRSPARPARPQRRCPGAPRSARTAAIEARIRSNGLETEDGGGAAGTQQAAHQHCHAHQRRASRREWWESSPDPCAWRCPSGSHGR